MSFTGTFYCERPLGLANAVSTANGVLGWFFLLRQEKELLNSCSVYSYAADLLNSCLPTADYLESSGSTSTLSYADTSNSSHPWAFTHVLPCPALTPQFFQFLGHFSAISYEPLSTTQYHAFLVSQHLSLITILSVSCSCLPRLTLYTLSAVCSIIYVE